MPKHEGYAHINAARAMLQLGNLYKLFEAIAQAVENEADAGAKQVWVVITPTTLEVVGDGHGMVPAIVPADRATLTEYLELATTGKLGADFEIRELISPTSRQSLEWMIEQISYSAKVPGEGDSGVRGMRGIGSLAYLSYAKRAVYYTRPTPALERDFIGRGGQPRDRRKTWQLTPPTRDMLERFDTSYEIDLAPENLSDPWGQPLQHGTHVVVSEILPGFKQEIQQTKLLITALQKRFGEDVRQGKYSLYVLDRLRKEEKLWSVTPIEYKGIKILQDEGIVDGVPFAIELYFNSRASTNNIQVLRKGSGVLELTGIPEFQSAPWTEVSGFVAFPNYPNDEDLWDSSKTLLLPTEQYHTWVQEILRFKPHIEKAIEQYLHAERTSGLDDIGKELSHAFNQALDELPHFEGLTVSRPQRSTRTKRPIQKGGMTAVIAKVVNEHSVGVPGISVTLFSGATSVATKVTGKSGSVTFGRQEFRAYKLRITLPQNTTPLSKTEQAFALTSTAPGHRAVFRIHTGAQAPPKLPSRTIRLVFLPFADDPEQPWRERLTVGNIDINTDAPDFRKAILDDDDDAKASLLAQYCAAAFVSYFFSSTMDPEEILLHGSILFGKTLEQFRKRLKTLRRSQAAKQR